MLKTLKRSAVGLLLLAGCGGGEPAAQQSTPTNASTPAPAKGSPAAPAPPKGPEHAVFSLTDNRLLAHLHRKGGILVVPGAAGFAKYERFARPKLSWKSGQKVDGKLVGQPDQYASLDIPATEAQAKSNYFAMRLKSTGAPLVEVKINGKLIKSVDLKVNEWQTVALTLPEGALVNGENNIQLVFGGGNKAVVEWFQLGGEAGGDDAPPLYDAAEKTLALPKGDGFSYFVQVPKAGRLLGEVVGGGCEVAVKATASDGATAEGVLAGNGAVDLSSLDGKIARLDLTGQGCDLAKLKGGALTVEGPTPEVKREKKPKHVIFWVMDSLRADRIKPFYPEARPEVPTFEKLASTAALFTNAYSQGNESRASHASMWTSLYPVNHQMIKDGAKVDEKWTTIDEAMRKAGFYNSGVSSNGYIISKWGFGSQWDAYRNHIHDGGGVKGADVYKFAIASIEKKLDKPVFLYIGTIDTHVSWIGKEPWFSKYDPAPYEGKYQKSISGTEVEELAAKKITPNERDRTRVVAMYDSNVSYQDDLLNQLLEQLKTWGVADDAMIVVTADHGDEQWEDGRVGHGSSTKETLVHVPLMVYYPPLFPGGLIPEGADAGVDILPTILDALGQTIPEQFQGESLLPLAQGVGRGYPRPTITSQYEFAHAMKMAGWKVRVGGNGVPTLFDIGKDHLETKDLAAEKPMERRFMTDTLSTFLVYQKKWKKWKWGVPSNALPAFADEVESL